MVDESDDLRESLDNIEKVIIDLNLRRDKGLDPELQAQLKKQLLISQVYNSNAIEGNKLSLRETQWSEVKGSVPVNPDRLWSTVQSSVYSANEGY